MKKLSCIPLDPLVDTEIFCGVWKYIIRYGCIPLDPLVDTEIF